MEKCLEPGTPPEGAWYTSQQHYHALDCDYSAPQVFLENKLVATAFSWIGGVGSGPGLHIDMADNVLCQVRGEKRVMLIPPQDTKYCYPRTDGQSNFSDITDVENDAENEIKFPLFKHATKYEVVIKPGDTLFIPTNWWHEIWALSPLCMSLNFFYRQAVGQKFGVTFDEYDLLEQLIREKFKRMAPAFRQHLIRYFDHMHHMLLVEPSESDDEAQDMYKSK